MSVSIEHFCIFDTTLGRCGVAWSEHGLTRLLLPGGDAGDMAATLSRRASLWNGALPEAIQPTVAAIVRYFSGEPVDFGEVVVDLAAADDFRRRVYMEARRLGWGKTATYGDLARRMGEPPEVARDVGQALGRNPLPLVVPCHRVLAAGGRIGGFSAPGGIATKARMLELEGVQVGVDESQGSLFAPQDLLPAGPPR